MAELGVKFALSKLEDIIAKEPKMLGRVKGQVEMVKTELTQIQCYLRDAESKRVDKNATVENWLNEVRNEAYRIEDVIDAFYLRLDDIRQKNSSFWEKLKWPCRNAKEVHALHKIAANLGGIHQKNHSLRQNFKWLCCNPSEVHALHILAEELLDIRKALDGIFKNGNNYGIQPLEEEVLVPSQRDHFDANEVLGYLYVDKNNILKLLYDELTPQRAVITIVGMGGLGKSTLARMVYESAKVDFEYHIMLEVSQKFNPIDLLRKMLYKPEYYEPEIQQVGDLFRELHDLLRGRRYLIILLNVWTTEVWEFLEYALPDDNNGSRVLMTSRFLEVAKSADRTIQPYEMRFLNEEDSLELLLKKVLPYQEQECPSELLELARILCSSCRGSQMALLIVGGILSTKEQTYHAWKSVADRIKGNALMDILAMSYEEHMPYYLKACFLYLASFPDVYDISAKRLIKMWIAEGFIPHQEIKTMEETAEDCLEQLFQRNMVQVSRRSPNGSIKYCRVHDIIQNLAIHMATGRENFVTTFQGDLENHPGKEPYRASLQSCHPGAMGFLGSKTRSLLWFGPEYNLPEYSKFRLLRVLEIVGVQMRRVTEIRGLDGLTNLKYLGFRNCAQLNIPTCSFDHLKNLETLDMRGTLIIDPPTSLWTISTLRHVLYDSFISGPPSSANLRNLQTVQWICVDDWHADQIPHLYNLRKLGLSSACSDWDAVSHLLEDLHSLISLGIKSWDIPKEIVYPTILRNYENLQSLHLEGYWSGGVTLEASLFPANLLKLTLVDSKLEQDPMLQLGKLNNLKKLQLEGKVYKGMQMKCSEGFPVLQILVLKDLKDVKIVTVAEGVMPELKYLTRSSGIKLELPPELNHLLKFNHSTGF
ncbi:Nbs-lrr resistance protein [Rhynchospora pubera]|uniref:Nbs-lrr resistance protein n=1 Tax=Rhynchospora pubera TaxID=906938 RepID=A0AAV8HJ63_9POAL|nr:Nbs-lrr resistance protein [Rhynchospora pubera]